MLMSSYPLRRKEIPAKSFSSEVNTTESMFFEQNFHKTKEITRKLLL